MKKLVKAVAVTFLLASLFASCGSKNPVAVTFLLASLFASCGSKNPVAGKKMALEAGGMSVTYIFTGNQFWLEGLLDGLKMNYRYDKENDCIVYTDLDDLESVIEMSKLREVK